MKWAIMAIPPWGMFINLGRIEGRPKTVWIIVGIVGCIIQIIGVIGLIKEAEL